MNFTIISALWKGRELANKDFWKSVQATGTLIFTTLTAIAALYPQAGITPELIQSFATAVANTGAIALGYSNLDASSSQWIVGFIGVLFTFLWHKYFKTATDAGSGFGSVPTESKTSDAGNGVQTSTTKSMSDDAKSVLTGE